MDDKNLGPGPYYDRWQRLKQTEKLRESLEDLYEKYMPQLILYIFEGRQVRSSKINRSLRHFNAFECILYGF